MNDYDYISDIYDIYNSADYDINYFINRYNNFSGQAIELMAGSGRLSIPLLKEGIKLDCLDISNGLLNELRKKLKKNIYLLNYSKKMFAIFIFFPGTYAQFGQTKSIYKRRN